MSVRDSGPAFWTSAGTLIVAVTLGMASTAVSCSDDTPASSSFDPDAGPPGNPPGSSGFQGSSDLPDAGPQTCVAKEAEAIEGKRPVDIIFAIDNSESMGGEIAEVEDQINENFRAIIEASGADYRVIMLSRHGDHDGISALQKICVRSPLSATSCAPIPEAPAETARFIHHDILVNSTDTFCKILQTFAGPDLNGAHPQGWGAYLRPTAFKVFAVITDDRVDVPETTCGPYAFDDGTIDPIRGESAAGTFDSALTALSNQFGTAARRNYVWHSIVGLAPFDGTDLAKPHPPTSPIVTTKCGTTAVAPATGYQALSRLTGGLRYPTCGLDFTTIFQAMARDVVDRSVLACDYAMPDNPAGAGKIDPKTAVVRHTSGATVTDFEQVADANACGARKFFIEGDRIKLCTDACLAVQADPAADVKILFGCLPKEAR